MTNYGGASREQVLERLRIHQSKPGPVSLNFGRYTHTPDFLITGLESSPAFRRLETYGTAEEKKSRQNRALGAAALLNDLARYDFLKLAEAKRVVDFGAGDGVPTLALAQLVKQNDGTVKALEQGPSKAVERGLLTPDQWYMGDGLAFLDDMEGCDLVTAFMLGPDAGDLVSKLLKSASRALNPQGHLIIRSDPTTTRDAKDIFAEAGVTYHDHYDTLITSFGEQ